MSFTAKGILKKFYDQKETNQGTPLQQIEFEQENGDAMYPTAIGKTMIAELLFLLPGDVVEIDFRIQGHKGIHNNVILEKITIK